MISLALLDANYMARRAVHTRKGLQSSFGLPTGGVYFFLNTLWSLLNLGSPILVFDGDRSPFRKAIFPEYKNKEKDPKFEEEAQFTFQVLDTLLPKMGLTSVKIPNAEADDVLYILTKHFTESFDVVVVSDDKDYFQFIKLGAILYQPMKGLYWDREKFKEAWGFYPEYFSLWRSMVGDTSDKIPGVSNLGIRNLEGLSKKELVSTYVVQQLKEPSLEALVDWSEKNPHPIGKRIISNLAIIKRNYLLIDLDQSDVSHDQVIDSFMAAKAKAKLDLKFVEKVFKSLEFKDNKWLSHLSR